MPTDGFITSFSQELPLYSDRAALGNTFSSSLYRTISENIIGATKFHIKTITGLDDDVRLSKRIGLNRNKLRGLSLIHI